MELYNADTGKLLCAHYPDYGKTNQVTQIYEVVFLFQVFDELGYLAIPPCIWGSKEVRSQIIRGEQTNKYVTSWRQKTA